MLALIEKTRAEWDAIIAQIEPARVTEPGVVGDWSVKDIIAHVIWGEREMVGVIRSRALVGSDLWNLPTDQRNAAMVEESRGRSLDEILKENPTLYQGLMAQIKMLKDEELNDAKYFRDMPSNWIPWQVIQGNTWTHYPEHVAHIRTWLARKTES